MKEYDDGVKIVIGIKWVLGPRARGDDVRGRGWVDTRVSICRRRDVEM